MTFLSPCKSGVATWQHPLKEIALQGTRQAEGKGKPSLGWVSFPPTAVGFAGQNINPKGSNYADDI